jgi:hypothetical protein
MGRKVARVVFSPPHMSEDRVKVVIRLDVARLMNNGSRADPICRFNSHLANAGITIASIKLRQKRYILSIPQQLKHYNGTEHYKLIQASQ